MTRTWKRRLALAAGALGLLGAVAVAALYFGYFVGSRELQPYDRWFKGVERRLQPAFGDRSGLAERLGRVEAIHLRFSGKVYPLPRPLTQGRGGGLASWDDDLLVMLTSGEVFYFDPAAGLRDSGLVPPDQGRAGLIELGATRYRGRKTGESELKFHEIEFVEQGPHRGLFVSYTYIDAGRECYRTRVAWLPVAASVANIRQLSASARDWRVVYETSPCLPFNAINELFIGNMAGGGLAYREPGLLYLASGDYYLDGRPLPDVGLQSTETDYGKVIEIDLAGGGARHFTSGHRNLQGLAFDPSGRLWGAEHGPRGGDEINLLLAGENYGWPLQTYGASYYESVDGWDGRHDRFRRPVFSFLPSVGLSSIAFLDGFEERWNGDMLLGSLVGQTLYHARVEEGRLVFLEPIPIGARIRDLRQFGRNRIALWLNTHQLVVLTAQPPPDPLAGLEGRLIARGQSAEVARAVNLQLPRCMECHAFREGEEKIGPSLIGILGRPVAGTSFEGYSDALRNKGGTWSEESLAAFLVAPDRYAPGTAMGPFGVESEERAAGMVEALRLLDSESTR